MNALSKEDYQFVSRFLYSEAGISLGGDKEYLVENRLSELCRDVGLKNISALVQDLKSRPGTENRQKMLEAMTTNETSFFRDGATFEAIRSTVLPELTKVRKSSRALRIWSAASSTGQEAYSLAMLLDSQLGNRRRDWALEIVATDIAEKVLCRARAGEYSQTEVERGLPIDYLTSYFKKSGRGWQIGQDIRSLVRFEKVNLMCVPASIGQFDLVFCRNVLIYFDVETKKRVLANLRRQLKPDGYLIVGAGEVLYGITAQFERLQLGGAVLYRPSG